MLLALRRVPQPGERDVVEARLLQTIHPLGGDIGRHQAGVHVDQVREPLALDFRERGGLDPGRRQRVDLRQDHGHDIGRRFRLYDRRRPLGVVEGVQQRAGGVFLGAEDARALLRAVTDFRGIRSEERGRAGRRAAADDVEADRDVVPLQPPAPCRLVARRAEDRDPVHLGVAWKTHAAFDRAQDFLELHDRRRGRKPARAQARLEEIVRESPLGLAHLLDGQAVPRKHLVGDEVPLQAFVGIEREDGLLALLRRKRREPLVRGACHRGRGPLRGDCETTDPGQDEHGCNRKAFHGGNPIK